MRIAIVTTSWPAFDGDPSGHFVQAEARVLAQRGEVGEVIVVRPPRGGAFGWPGVAANVRARPWTACGALAWVAGARRELARAGAVARVVAHWAVPSAFIGEAANAPIEVVSHGADVRLLAALPGAIRSRAVRRIAERADAWRFVSEALLDGLNASLDGATRRTVDRVARVEPCAIEMPDVRAAADARRRLLGGFDVCVARLIASKRVDRAIDHAAACRRPLVVVGDGPERGRLEAHARRAHGANVRFVGTAHRADALAWIAAAEHVLFASTAEGLSTVLREAEALGTAVVWV